MNFEMIDESFTRSKGLSWFKYAYNTPVVIIGQGGIGSFCSLAYSRCGSLLFIYDGDTFQNHNLGQFTNKSSIGKNKATAIKDILRDFTPTCTVYTNSTIYNYEGLVDNVMVCCVDNMIARKIAFENWNEYRKGLTDEQQKHCLFQDGRLTPNVMQIYNIQGDREDQVEEYLKKEHLFDDSEVPELNCTQKQTTNTAMMISGWMCGFYQNWLDNIYNGTEKSVPFLHEFNLSFNLIS